MMFREKVEAAWRDSNSLLCVGLDPELALLPEGFGIEDVARFNIAIIEATSDLVCAYKPNVAFYEGLGPERGYGALRQTLAAIPSHIVTIADAKRGDVEHTARAYVRALFDDLGFDCSTVNAYLGRDSIEPWIEDPDHGAIVVTRTSNPGAPDLQDVQVSDGASRPLFELVAERARSWDTHGNICLVTGATYPAEMRRLRELCPDMPFLVPGIGAQAGALDEAVRAGLDRRGAGLFVSASRGITYASRGADFAEAARREALRLRDEINIVRAQLAPAGG